MFFCPVVKWVLLCICVSIHMSLIAWESICSFVKLQCILEIFIIWLLFCYGKFSMEELHMLFNFGQDIWNNKGFTKMGLTFILVGSNIWIVIIWQYVVLWAQF